MAFGIITNTPSLDAQRNLGTSQASLQTSLQRLSSGLRINSAKDDAAGLAIATRFQAQINGNGQAIRNANDGISLAQTAEGGLTTAGDLLQRIRTLAVQSANGSNSGSDRTNMQNEVTALTTELNRVATNTQFNGQNVIDGSMTNTQFQIGANANQTVSFGIASAKSTDLGNNTLGTSVAATGSANISTAKAGQTNGVTGQTLTINSLAGTQTTLAVTGGDSAAKIAANINGLTFNSGVTATASTTATLADIKEGSAQFTLQGANSSAVTISASVKNGDLSGLAQAINAQTNTTNITASVVQTAGGTKTIVLNDNQGNDIKIGNMTTGTGLEGATFTGVGGDDYTLQPGAATTAYATVGGKLSFSSSGGFSIASSAADNTLFTSAAGVANGSSLSSVAALDISTTAGANAALLTIDAALNQISANRSALGAIQNRLNSTVSNLQITTQNLSASQSRIQETDFAAETANLTRGQILQQAGTAMLAQANSLPNGVLSLLRG